MEDLYEMIFKRKSVRKFDEELLVSEKEMKAIKNKIENLVPLDNDIRVKFRIVKRTETTSKRGEYCLLMYSERKPCYLLNAGYMLEQMDLFFASQDIGACWYALAKTTELKYEGLDYVIMMAFGKSRPEHFRKDLLKCNRKDSKTLWNGEFNQNVVDVVRYAPSACNTQPWKVVSDNNCIKVYRSTLIRSFMPANKLPYYNSIDMGIFLCFLEIALKHSNYAFDRTLGIEQNSNEENIEIATYNIYTVLGKI
ncbi:MAG: hypothetical protein K0S04_516 [Herbinix sp.]|nr:hypothetical protein [Herbinix sp.]